MSSIVFKGIDIKNRAIDIEVKYFDRIGFERLNLQSIDLSPFKDWELSDRVRLLALHENYLSKIDLKPLSSCTNLQVIHLGNNRLSTIDLSPLANCKRLNKIYLYHNNLSEIDLKPLENLNSLAGLFLHGNPLVEVELSHIPSNIKRIEINESYSLINADHVLSKITLNNEPRPQIRYEREVDLDVEDSYEFYGDDLSIYQDGGRSPNDQRSDVMNPNNPEYKAAKDNRANQLNPKHPAYRSSRGKK